MTNYKHFDFKVEEMSEEDAQTLLKGVIAMAEMKGLHLGGGFRSETDEDLKSWNVVKDHLRAIVREIRMVFEAWKADVIATLPDGFPWD